MKELSQVAAGLAAALLVAVPAMQTQAADTGSWLVRGRALYLDPANSDDTGLNLSINRKTFPELDISYFFSPNLAAELVLTYPQRQDLRSNGVQIGSLKHLPPTLTLQYHFTGLSGARPYVGAGINYTRFSDVQFDPAVVAALNPSIKKDSWGLAVGAGVDIPFGNEGWLFNVDLKKVQIGTDVYSSGTKVGSFKVDPVLFSIGIGKRF